MKKIYPVVVHFYKSKYIAYQALLYSSFIEKVSVNLYIPVI